MGVQACRLPALKPLKPLKPLKTLKRLKTLTTRHGGPSLPFAMLHPAANRHPKATHQWLLMGVQACRLPALKPLKPLKTLKRLKTLTTRHGGPSLPFAMLHPAANRHPKATHQWLLMGVQACRLPALKPLKPLQPVMGVQACRLPCFILHPTGTPRPLINGFFWASLTTRHGGPSLPFAMLHPAANRHPKATHQWLLMGVQACRLPALKRLKPLKTLKRLKTLTTCHGGPSLPFAMLHPAANRHPKATHQWLLMGVQACRLPALKPLKPLKTLKRLKTLTTRHGGPSLPFAMLHPAANRHPKATHQWLLMGVQACRLPALKPLKPLKTLKRLKTLTTRHGGPSLPFAMLHPAANRHPKATHQWLLMGVQACRLPALKPLKPLKTFKRLKTLTTRHGGPSLPFAMLHPAANRHPKATHQWLLMGVQACGGPSLPFAMLHPAANRHLKATHQWLLMGVQACRLPALKPLKPLKTIKTQQAPQGHTSMASYGRPSLPFASP